MKYSISYEVSALNHLRKIEKSGRKSDINRVYRFIEEIKIHPRTGTGKPEQMKHQKQGKEVWSRRVNKNDRFVYHISESDKNILVIQSLGHYDDK